MSKVVKHWSVSWLKLSYVLSYNLFICSINIYVSQKDPNHNYLYKIKYLIKCYYELILVTHAHSDLDHYTEPAIQRWTRIP